jgi:hypothetical protein
MYAYARSQTTSHPPFPSLLLFRSHTRTCSGGDRLDELYVTTAREDVAESDLRSVKHHFSGHLFRIRGLGVRGVPSAAFRAAGPLPVAVPLPATESESESRPHVVVPLILQAFVATAVGADWMDACAGADAGK